MSSYTEQLLKEHSRSLRLIDKQLCCIIDSVEFGAGNHVFLKGLFDAGVDTMSPLTIDNDNAGVYTALLQDGSSGTILIDVNGSGFLPFVFPLTLVAGDVIDVQRSIFATAGFYKIIGTYIP